MSENDSPNEITEFLKQYKQTLQNGKFTFIPRNENITTIGYLRLSIKNVKEIILSLTFKDYCGGPLNDAKYPGYLLWEFGVNNGGDEIYIKLSDDYRYNYAKCVSFHIACREMKYPYKEK